MKRALCAPSLGSAIVSLALSGFIVASCGGSEAPEGSEPSSGDGDGTSPGASGDGDGAPSDINVDTLGDGDQEGVVCSQEPGDNDGDGFSVAEGDCNDCDVNANPGALDVPGNDVDENCDSIADNQDACDATLNQPETPDPLLAAQAIGLCAEALEDDRRWGVIEAKYTLADGTELTPRSHIGHAILDHFGAEVVPQEGERLLSLSTGVATNPHPDDPTTYARTGYRQLTSVSAPEGFPTESTACPNVTPDAESLANDSMVLELKMRAPTNAQSLSFDFDFYTYEFPDFVCHTYNDNFVVLMDPPPADAVSGNISFDNQGNTVSVNNAYLEVCDAGEAGLDAYDCPQGASALEGTGYEIYSAPKAGKGGATGWLNTTVPVEPGSEFTLRFMIWDSGLSDAGVEPTPDYVNDSTVLLDNFQFSAMPASGTVTRPITR